MHIHHPQPEQQIQKMGERQGKLLFFLKLHTFVFISIDKKHEL